MTPPVSHYNIQWLTQQHEDGAELRFLYFWGHRQQKPNHTDKSCLSQWFPAAFTVDGIQYKTAEHWMMAKKALLFNDEEKFHQIINCESPGEAKKLGSLVAGFDETVWNENKFRIVCDGSMHKFRQNPSMLHFLRTTGNKVLVEASPVDTIWGIGLPPEKAENTNIRNWRGTNLLGFALMHARDELK